MKRLLRGGTVVNVFTGELERADVLIENEKIILRIFTTAVLVYIQDVINVSST